MNPTKIVFETDKFMSKLQTYSQALNESFNKNLKSQMEKEINSKISSKKANIDTQTLNAFKKKVSSTYTGTTPDAIYKVLIQNMSDEILASDYFKLENDLDDDPATLTKFLAKVANYIYDILDKKKTTVTVDKKKYQVEFTFGTTGNVANVTDLSNNKNYFLTWKDTGATLKTLTNFMSDLIAYEKSSSYQIVKKYLLDVISIAVDDYFDYLADHATVTKNISDYLKNKLSDYKEELESVGYTIDSIKEFFKAFFPQTDSELTQIQKNYQGFTKYEAELEKAISKLKNPDADTVKNLTAYKNFLSAYKTLSGTTLNISPEDYVTYYFKDVHNAEITQSRASIVGTSQVDSIISEGKNSTIYGESGNDALLIEGDYSKVYGGAGKDSIIITGANVKAEGGYGQDTIWVQGSNITVTGDGETFDYLPIGDTFIIDSSARNILITDFEKSADKLQLNFSDIVVDLVFINSEQSLVILTADKYEKIATLQGVNESSFNNITYDGITTSIDWLLENKKFTVKNPYENIIQVKNNTLENTLSGVQIQAESGNNTITNKGSEVTISAGAGNDYVNNYGDNVIISGGKGDDTIYNDDPGDPSAGLNVVINAGSGNDLISNDNSGAIISGGDGNDNITNYGTNVSISGGSGNDFIKNPVYAVGNGESVTIDAGEGNDTIQNYSSKVTINGGNGDDDIQNNASMAAIYGQSGNDWIQNTGYNVTIDGGIGNDYIYSSQEYSGGFGTILGGSGNDTIRNRGSRIFIDGGEDNDYIYDIDGLKNTLNGGNGDDSIYSKSGISGTTIDGGIGNDYIENQGQANVKIIGGTGNDTIKDFGNQSNIKAGEGNDSILVRNVQGSFIDGESGNDTILASGVKNLTIHAGSGNDSINSSGSNLLIYGDSGKNTIDHSGNESSVNGGIENDYIFVGGKNNIVQGSKGNDLIQFNDYQGYVNILAYSNGDGNDTVFGFNHNDTLQIMGSTYTTVKSGSDIVVRVGNGSIKLIDTAFDVLNIQGTLGTDTISTLETAKNITNTNSNTMISGTTYADTISNSASRVTIEGAADNDSITSVGDRVSISGGTGNDTLYSDVAGSIESGSNVTINGGAGDDYISNDSAYSKLEGNDGKDTITNYGWNTTIDGGTGNDIINNFKAFGDEGNNVSINGGAGNDSITSTATKVSIDGGDGKDTIWAWSSNIFVDGGADNDYIYAGNYETNTTIYGGYGDDTINNFNSKSYIRGGVGNDLIYNDNQPNNIFLYTAGDGNDTIFGFASSDTIQINAGKLSNASVNGSNIRLTIGNGSILLKDAKDKNITVKDSAGTHTFKNTYSGSATVPTNNFTSGNDYYSNSTANITLNALGGNDIIYNHANKVLIKGGAGNDTIYSWSGKSYIEGDGGADYIYSGGSNHTVIGGKGNDLISLMAAAHYNTVKYASGDGKDTIYGLDSDDTLQITGAKYTTAKSGSDLIIGVGNDSISVVGGANVAFKINGTLKSNIADGISVKNSIVTASKNFKGNKINLSDYAATKVNASAVTQAVSIVGTAAANSLKGGKGADTISGGAGNDTVSLGGGKDVYIYSGGNDVIQDYIAGQDKIKLLSGTISGASVSGNDVVLKVGSGSITVKKGKGKYITTVDSKGNASVDIYDQSNGVQVKEIDNRYGSGVTLLSGGSGNDTIWNAEFWVSINGGAGDDWIDSDADNVTINGGSGSDSILTGNNYVSIYGGDGNDWIGNFEGYNVTINGGKGNDTINNYESSRTVIKYASGDGDDVISNINDNDTLQITGSTYMTMKSGSDVVFKVGNGSITVKNAVNSRFNIDFKSSSVSNSRTLDLMYDNNFITNELQIDDISEVTETNYSVGQIENSGNSNKFVMDSIVAAASFDKK